MDPVETKKPKVLFVEDKWCAGKFEWGISEYENNLFLSLKETGIVELEAFHFDDYYRLHEKKGDEALLQKIKEWKPDLILTVIYKMPGSAVNVPEWTTIKTIKNDLQIPIAAIWGDCYNPVLLGILKAMDPYTAFNAVGDSGTVVKRIRSSISNPEKYAYMWVPKSPTVFNDPGKDRDIGFSYYGSTRKSRIPRILHLQKNNIPIICGGGETSEHLTTEQYADRYQRSKITLSFSRATYCHVMNSRPFEAMACGAMILEEEGFETPKFFTPYVDYVPYSSNKDLVKKAKYYLEHDDERERIAKSGWRKTTALYTSDRYWNFLIDRSLGSPKKIKMPEFPLTWANLSHMPKWRAAKLKFLEFLCSYELGFKIYLYVVMRADRGWINFQLNKIKRLVNSKNA